MKKIVTVLMLVGTSLGLFVGVSAASTSSVQAQVKFKIYSPTTFAGFALKAFALSDGTTCSDHAQVAFVLGGKGTFGNSYPGVNIFEKAAHTCNSGTGFNKQIATVLIRGHRAQVWSNCAGVAAGQCGAAQVKRNGGLVTWTVPAVSGFRATTVSVTTYNLAYSVLLAVARGIK